MFVLGLQHWGASRFAFPTATTPFLPSMTHAFVLSFACASVAGMARDRHPQPRAAKHGTKKDGHEHAHEEDGVGSFPLTAHWHGASREPVTRNWCMPWCKPSFPRSTVLRGPFYTASLAPGLAQQNTPLKSLLAFSTWCDRGQPWPVPRSIGAAQHSLTPAAK